MRKDINEVDYSYIDEDYEKAGTAASVVKVPVGIYKVTVNAFGIETSKNGNDMIGWVFEITEGEYKGVELRFFTTIPNISERGSEAWEWKIKKLSNTVRKIAPQCSFNYVIKKMTKYILDTELVVQVENKKDSDYQNVRIVSVPHPLPATAEEAKEMKKKGTLEEEPKKERQQSGSYDPFEDD